MKIGHKLIGVFSINYLLLGGVVGIFIITNAMIKHNVKQVNQSSIKEIEAATEMVFTLEVIHSAAQEVIAERTKAVIDPKYIAEAEKEVKKAQKKIEEEVDNFENHLLFSRKATETAIQIANTVRDEESEIKSQES